MPFYVYSEVLYTLVRTEGRVPSCHDTATMRKWVWTVGEEIGVPLKATQSVMSAIWQQATKVASQFKELKGGRQQREYLQVELKLELQHGDLLTSKEKAYKRSLLLQTRRMNAYRQKCQKWKNQMRN